MRMSGRGEYKVRLSLAGKYRIGLNIVRRGKIGVKGLFLEYDEYSAKYSPTPSLKPLSWFRIFCRVFAGYVGFCVRTWWVLGVFLCALNRISTLPDNGQHLRHFRDCIWQHCGDWMLKCWKVLLDCVMLGYSWRASWFPEVDVGW